MASFPDYCLVCKKTNFNPVCEKCLHEERNTVSSGIHYTTMMILALVTRNYDMDDIKAWLRVLAGCPGPNPDNDCPDSSIPSLNPDGYFGYYVTTHRCDKCNAAAGAAAAAGAGAGAATD